MSNELPVIHIRMLGEFSIHTEEHSISDQINHSKKLWNLLAYLITYRNREIAQSELFHLLWAEDESNNPTGALKTLMHRVRNLLKDLDYPTELVVQRRGTYAWNTKIPCILDTDEFEQLCQDASYMQDHKLRLEYYKKALALYKGVFLPKNNKEAWVVPVSEYYQSKYLEASHHTISILMDRGSYAEVANVCWQALSADPYCEPFHYNLIRSLFLCGNQRAALRQYTTTTNMFFTKFGITPSKELTALYKEIMKTKKIIESDLDIIKASLKESQRKNGSFFCEYEFFKDIYRLEARAAIRTGSSIHICLITVTSDLDEVPELTILNKAMDNLKETLFENLRSSDVFSRYSISQYLVMLPNTSRETADMVMKRLLFQFGKKFSKGDIKIHYTLQPLDPAD